MRLLTAEAAEAMAADLRGRSADEEGIVHSVYGDRADSRRAKNLIDEARELAQYADALDAHAAALRAGGSDEVDAQIGRADRVISELCNGTRRWTMSVPARPDDDPDLVLSKALGGARVALATLREQLSTVTAERDALLQEKELVGLALVQLNEKADRALRALRTQREGA